MVDFGNKKTHFELFDCLVAKYVPDKTYTFCGTPMYIAPEVINWKGHNKGADHWSWACMVYEMVTGKYPFYKSDMQEMELFKKISRAEFKLFGFMSFEVKLLLISLFVPDSTRRMGSRANGWQEIFDAPWFADVDFQAIRRQTIQAPWVPTLKDPLDSSNFGDFSGLEDKMEANEPTLSEEEQHIFKSFGTVSDLAEF
jgi:serine/threonine protein kinase